MRHPYEALDDFCFWSRAMSSPAPGHIDPITVSEIISPDDKVVTIGSCFAQHLAKHVSKSGLDYFVPEHAPTDMGKDEAQRRNYGVFSARYGNIYTVRQAVQLFDRAFGKFSPKEDAWVRSDGRWVDAFRPRIEPDGFSTPEEVRQSAVEHLVYVREVFTKCKWLVFTLGLTEAWRSTTDGAVYPLAPGVSGGCYNPAKHEFVNFSLTEVWNDLDAFIQKIQSVNRDARILLTISPVPLMATYEPRHVLVSTTCSKAILRVAADQAERTYRHVVYFPAYEIITSPAAAGRYYEDDLRQVTELGVSHVMRLFSRHFIDASYGGSDLQGLEMNSVGADVECDEEAIQGAIKASGLS